MSPPSSMCIQKPSVNVVSPTVLRNSGVLSLLTCIKNSSLQTLSQVISNSVLLYVSLPPSPPPPPPPAPFTLLVTFDLCVCVCVCVLCVMLCCVCLFCFLFVVVVRNPPVLALIQPACLHGRKKYIYKQTKKVIYHQSFALLLCFSLCAKRGGHFGALIQSFCLSVVFAGGFWCVFYLTTLRAFCAAEYYL